jgi:hypothetical protein
MKKTQPSLEQIWKFTGQSWPTSILSYHFNPVKTGSLNDLTDLKFSFHVSIWTLPNFPHVEREKPPRNQIQMSYRHKAPVRQEPSSIPTLNSPLKRPLKIRLSWVGAIFIIINIKARLWTVWIHYAYFYHAIFYFISLYFIELFFKCLYSHG